MNEYRDAGKPAHRMLADFATRAATHPKPDVRAAALTSLGAIASKRPALLDSALVESLAQIAATERYTDVRYEAMQAIGVIVETRPDLITAALVRGVARNARAVLKEPWSGWLDGCYRCEALTVLGAMIKQDPKLANAKLIAIVAQAAAHDFDWAVREDGQITLGLIIGERPDLAHTAVSVDSDGPHNGNGGLLQGFRDGALNLLSKLFPKKGAPGFAAFPKPRITAAAARLHI